MHAHWIHHISRHDYKPCIDALRTKSLPHRLADFPRPTNGTPAIVGLNCCAQKGLGVKHLLCDPIQKLCGSHMMNTNPPSKDRKNVQYQSPGKLLITSQGAGYIPETTAVFNSKDKDTPGNNDLFVVDCIGQSLESTVSPIGQLLYPITIHSALIHPEPPSTSEECTTQHHNLRIEEIPASPIRSWMHSSLLHPSAEARLSGARKTQTARRYYRMLKILINSEHKDLGTYHWPCSHLSV